MAEKLALVDGNSIMNRAFYGIMGKNILTTKDGQYTNAIYGFLNILFKLLEDEKPKYLVVSFDLSRPVERLKLYSEYKAGRNKMPEELASQFPIIKKILKDMNIDVVEYEGIEADDILGTLSKYGEENNLDVVILSGDRDTFQLASDKTTIKIPRTQNGKTVTQNYDKTKIKEEYNLEPQQLIDVKGLQGDPSDNIPGVPGVGEKTALKLINEYSSIEKLYDAIKKNEDNLKGKTREKIKENKELAFLSKKLGTINRDVKIEHTLKDFIVEPWDDEKVLEDFKKLNFNKFIEKFNLLSNIGNNDSTDENKQINKEFESYEIIDEPDIGLLKKTIEEKSQIYYMLSTKEQDLENELLINKQIDKIYILDKDNKKIYCIQLDNIENSGLNEIIDEEISTKNLENPSFKFIKEIFENTNIKKYSYDLASQYILLKQIGITIENIYYDVKIASYLLNPTDQRLNYSDLLDRFLGVEKCEEDEKQEKQLEQETYYLLELVDVLNTKLEQIDSVDLFRNIEMPTVEVLANMRWNGIYVDKEELEQYGINLEQHIEQLKDKIYEVSGEEFNINSTKQLGVILFEKLGLPVIKKNKTGYSTDTAVLEKLQGTHEIIDLITDYRAYTKLFNTYVEGMIPLINKKTSRIHSTFLQTKTATGRISSIEPNLQNIPTKTELGKQLRKVFKAGPGNSFVDGDYSQIELRVLADVSNDETMIHSFKNDLDIHKMAASKVFNVPIDEITNEQRSYAKAVNFGIVYGISDFGLSQTLKTSKKQAKEYIDQYLNEYVGINKYLKDIVFDAKQKGYVETLFNRRRYIPEISSSNAIVRKFGERVAMNSPIQGTAADIMKIAMIKVFRYIKENNLDAKIVLQIHDELIVQVKEKDEKEFSLMMKEQMQDVAHLKVPLIVNVESANNWYDCK